MKNSIYDKWLLQLQNELLLIEGLYISPLERLHHSLPIINRVNSELREYILREGFINEEEEVYFFKLVKPKFIALQLYESLFYSLSTQTPCGTKEMVNAYYEGELLQVLREFRLNEFHYQYYRTKATELDHLYFLRNAKPINIPIVDLSEPFPGYSTAMDYSIAKFIAYERLQAYLLELMTDVYAERRMVKQGLEIGLKLKWTGESINLVELAYGIWLTGQINNGNASITEIIQWLEVNFRVKIGLAFRRWYAISQRKRVSTTKYVDQMRAAILKRLDDENILK